MFGLGPNEILFLVIGFIVLLIIPVFTAYLMGKQKED